MCFRFARKSASTEVWCGRAPEDLPTKKLAEFRSDIFASYSGPDVGLGLIHQLELAKENGKFCLKAKLVTCVKTVENVFMYTVSMFKQMKYREFTFRFKEMNHMKFTLSFKAMELEIHIQF